MWNGCIVARWGLTAVPPASAHGDTLDGPVDELVRLLTRLFDESVSDAAHQESKEITR